MRFVLFFLTMLACSQSYPKDSTQLQEKRKREGIECDYMRHRMRSRDRARQDYYNYIRRRQQHGDMCHINHPTVKHKGLFGIDLRPPLKNEGIYINQMGDIIIDIKLFNDGKGKLKPRANPKLRCTVCNEEIQFEEALDHYEKTSHRYLLKTHKCKGKK